MNILVICGSLRKGSYNRQLLQLAVAEAQRQGATVTEAEIGDIPLYTGDLEVEPWSAPAKRFYDQIKAAEAVLIVSPEYNYSIPGGLKNALDWASRGDNAWKDKTVALMGVSIGPVGTARGQMHLRQALLGTGPIWVVPQPQVCLKNDQIDDPKTLDRVSALIQNLIAAAQKAR
jgi:chromate reductase, NAD(P)H dehydrogenase (quinone)